MESRKKVILIAFLVFLQSLHAEAYRLSDLNEIESPNSISLDVNLPEIPTGKQARLSLMGRIHLDHEGGSDPRLLVYINNNIISGPDLINKPMQFFMINGMDADWVHGNRWRLVYCPDFSDRARTSGFMYSIPDVDPLTFIWDITKYVKPGANKIQLKHLKNLTTPSPIVLKDINLEIGDPIVSAQSTSIEPAPQGKLPTYIPSESSKNIPIEATLYDSGAMSINISGNNFEFFSRTSEPKGKWVETVAARNSQIIKKPGENATAKWTAEGYTVERNITLMQDYIKVADTISNTTDKIIGLMYENRLSLKSKPDAIYLSGFKAYAPYQMDSHPQNPTSAASWSKITIGMVAVDDIYRIHSENFCEPNAIGIADRQLAIPVGKSHTLEWSIYPAINGDYWDMINTIRRTWGCNFTIPEATAFNYTDGSETAQFYKDWTEQIGVKCQLTGQTAFKGDEIAQYGGKHKNYLAEGTAIPLAVKWCQGQQEWIKKLKSVVPDAKVNIYLHASICTEPNAETKYSDCKQIAADGSHVKTPYFYPVYMYLSTVDNAYGKALQKTVKWIIEDQKYDGIFLDEMSCNYQYIYNDNVWDNCTAIINRTTHEMTGKRSSDVLLQQDWKVWLANYLRQNNKILIGNGAPGTRTELNLHVPRFVEMNSYSFMAYNHLGSPWGLARPGLHGPEARAFMVRNFLKNGGLLTPYASQDIDRVPTDQINYLKLMYPITPIEIRSGMVLGKERFITCRSGIYGWLDGADGDIYVFNAQGKHVEDASCKKINTNNKSLFEIRMPGDHFAIIIRK